VRLQEVEEEVRRQEAAERQERRRKEEEERQKEETDFMRAWREPISLLENTKGKVGPRRPWMQGIRESKYDFSKLEEDEEDYLEVVVAQEKVLSTDFAAFSLENGVPLDGVVETEPFLVMLRFFNSGSCNKAVSFPKSRKNKVRTISK
jgi:hypothetical protein